MTGTTGSTASTASTGETGAFPYKLVATDLDGTLLRSDDTVSER
ncbi:hydrolase, partial [Streptomyces umbrinus]